MALRRMVRRAIASDMMVVELRDRVAASNQLLLTLIAGGIFLSGVLGGWLADAPAFAAGVVIIVLAAVAALAVPWSRIEPAWVAVIPLVDIGAIALVRSADASPGLALLWAFPTMWLSSMGRIPFIVACVTTIGAYWALLLVVPGTTWSWAVIVLPAVIVAIGLTTYHSFRRAAAQRTLLDRQTTRLAAALRQASAQEELLTEVLDTVDFGVIRLDAAGDVTFVNDALGRFQQRVPGFGNIDDDAELFAADGVTPLAREEWPFARIMRGEAFSDLVVWFTISPTQRVALSLTSRRLRGVHGEPAGVVMVARDVTEELTALKARDTLVASVSHELRTPLTSILGYLELALDGEELPDPARRHLDVAHRNSERLLGIISSILSASTASRLSAEISVAPEPADLADVLRASAADLARSAEERAIRISVDEVAPAVAFIDAARMRQVVDNLVTNAIKFNRDGGSISLGSATDGTTSWFLVQDTGIGLAPENRDRVFERFFRAESGVSGTGLGLAISREIVRAHGGDISLTSTLGLGTTFMVRLPATAEAAAAAARADAETAGVDA